MRPIFEMAALKNRLGFKTDSHIPIATETEHSPSKTHELQEIACVSAKCSAKDLKDPCVSEASFNFFFLILKCPQIMDYNFGAVGSGVGWELFFSALTQAVWFLIYY